MANAVTVAGTVRATGTMQSEPGKITISNFVMATPGLLNPPNIVSAPSRVTRFDTQDGRLGIQIDKPPIYKSSGKKHRGCVPKRHYYRSRSLGTQRKLMTMPTRFLYATIAVTLYLVAISVPFAFFEHRSELLHCNGSYDYEHCVAGETPGVILIALGIAILSAKNQVSQLDSRVAKKSSGAS